MSCNTLAGVVLALLLSALPMHATAQQLIGTQTSGPQSDKNAAGKAEAFRATAALSGTVASITVYVDVTSTATVLTTGLYSDAAGRPGTLLAQGSLIAPVAGQWNKVPVQAANVVAKTVYWIAVLGPRGKGVLAFRDYPAGNGLNFTSAETNLDSLKATWTNGVAYTNAPISAFASAATSTQPILSTSPSALNFSYAQGDPAPAASSLSVTNTGGGTLSFSA
ncbi:MAG: hypothetical protein ABI612_25290, partial [Betaproteobacteria bacterium]